VRDSFFVFLFGFIEAVMIKCLSSEDLIGRIHLCLCPAFFLGFLAYRHAEHRLREPYVLKVFEEHYSSNHQMIYAAMIGFERKSQKITLMFSLIFLGFMWIPLKEPKASPFISLVSSASLLFFLFHWDLKRWLYNSDRRKELEESGKPILELVERRATDERLSSLC